MWIILYFKAQLRNYESSVKRNYIFILSFTPVCLSIYLYVSMRKCAMSLSPSFFLSGQDKFFSVICLGQTNFQFFVWARHLSEQKCLGRKAQIKTFVWVKISGQINGTNRFKVLGPFWARVKDQVILPLSICLPTLPDRENE